MKSLSKYGALRRFIAVFAMITIGTALTNRTRANPGILDDAFGTGGKVVTGFGSGDSDDADAIAVQPDGKIVVAGNTRAGSNNNFALARYNVDGSLDSTFGTGGKVTTDFFGDFDFATSIAVVSGNKILVAGGAYDGSTNHIALARYNTDGSPDATFDTDGKVTIPFGRSASAMAIQSDGKIVVSGVQNNGGYNDFAVARLNADGSLDTTFDTDGKVTTDTGGRGERTYSVAIQTDGKIIVAGETNDDGPTDWDIALVRYNTDGSLDTGFDGDGIVKTDFGNTRDWGRSVAIQTDGKIVLAGQTGTGSATNFALLRYHTNGSLDTTFSSDGMLQTDFFGEADVAYSVILQPDGKIIAGGYADIGNDVHDFALARYHSDGSLDPQFGKGGKVTTDFDDGDDTARDMVLQSDGKILLAGNTYNGTSRDFALARYGVDHQADNIISGRGNNLYNLSGAGQTKKLVSKKARTVTASLVIQNDGVNTDTLGLRGTRGNNFFKVIYSVGGNVTGQVVAGTFVTSALNPGETQTIQITIKPNKAKLRKKTKKGKKTSIKWLRKTITLALTSSSQMDGEKKDVAKVKVQHK